LALVSEQVPFSNKMPYCGVHLHIPLFVFPQVVLSIISLQFLRSPLERPLFDPCVHTLAALLGSSDIDAI
jgi:hypothetical protein